MRRVGGAHRGLDTWLLQRFSAVYLALALPVFLLVVLSHGPLDYTAWRALFASLAMKLAGMTFVFALLAHAWIGVREIGIDYVQHLGVRLVYFLVFAMLYLTCLVWAAAILWSV